MDAIVAEGLTKTYKGGVQALSGVSFNVQQGEIFGLLGPNGAGKSTIVRILATLTLPTSGRASVAGHDILDDPLGVRRRLGYVAQASGVDRWGTGRENLVLQANLQRMPRSAIPARVTEVLEWVGLTDAANQLVHTYSGGMQRRLDIAMGLIHEPAVLFLDEPTTGLDPESRTALWRDLVRLRQEQNLAVLLTTHYLEEADRLCDRMAIVDHGEVVVEGVPSALKAEIQGDTVILDVGRSMDQARTTVGEVAGVLEVIPNGSELIVRVGQGATAVPVLVSALEQAGVQVEAVTLSRPSLDDVYLHYTGQRFTADGDDGVESPNGHVQQGSRV